MKSEKINKQIEWYYLLFCGLIYFLIVAHSNGKTMYWVPLLLSGFLIIYYIKNLSLNLNLLKQDYKRFGVLWVLCSFIFFYFFVGFDFVPNEIHNDLAYYGAMGDHLYAAKTEFTPIDPFYYTTNSKPYLPLYHFTEFWISGIIGNLFNVPAIWILLLFIYPTFLSFSLLILFHMLPKFGVTQLSFSKYISSLSAFLLFSTLLSFIAFKYGNTQFDLITMPLYSWFKSGYIKLLIAMPIVLIVVFQTFDSKINIYKITLISCTAFLYPTLIPITLSLFVGFLITNYLIQQPKFGLFYILLLLILIAIISIKLPNHLREFTHAPKMYIIRLGVIGVLFLHLIPKYNVRTLLAYLIKFIIIMSVIIYFTSFLKITNIDYYQLFDNFNTPLAQLTILFCIIFIFERLNFKPNVLIPVFILPALLLIEPLSNKNIVTDFKNKNTAQKLNENTSEKINIYVISDTINPIESGYYTNPYMLLSNKYLPWHTKNFKVINGLQISPARNQKDSLFNATNAQTLRFIHNTDFKKKHNVGNIVYQ